MNTCLAERLARLYLWSTRLAAMTAKELIQFGRDTLLLIAIVYLFIFDTYMAGNVGMQLNSAVVVVHDADHSAASRELIYRFHRPYFKLGGEVLDSREGQRLLDRGQALVVLDIPRDFEHDIKMGRPVDVQVQVDASNTILGFLASSYTAQIIGQYGFDKALAHLGVTERSMQDVPMIRDEHRIWYNPNQRDAWFMPIVELLIVITIMAIMLPAAAAAVREKERGTIEQLLVSPLTPMQILLPKVIAMTLVILLGTAVSMFFVLHWAFDVPMKGSLTLFFAVTTLYTFTTAGLGLYIATLSRNLAQAALLAILVLMPMIFLSGAWTPPEAMPAGMRAAMFLSPLYYFIEMGYGIMLKGAGLDVLWDSLLGLALLGMAVFGVGVWRFTRQFG
ncbi:ABC transporter permease [Ferribacterium limneticum]|uniref:ABC transporter permease n=1 Tax=Ferribacterium limneticum TaxID=76259 RepID=UPI001CF7FA66|nr:ABC transporter permease [Ferribacterium limneticum]UCV23635.1 ABC transporter permease [Ferribacterium limneticum]